jgi:hypothetical protein
LHQTLKYYSPFVEKLMAMWKKIKSPLLASMTLGLAPFVPEPHIVGKVRWVWGGAVGMEPMDWFDFVFHGAPWVWLIVSISLALINHFKLGPQKV